LIRGIVRDSLTTEGLPYASVRIPGAKISVVADSRGIFEIAVPASADSMTASGVGYAAKTVRLVPTSHNLYDIMLAQETSMLKELVVKKEKYSKHNNPAVDFASRLRRSGGDTSPRRNDYYSYDSYERISMGIQDVDTTRNSALLRHMPGIIDHVDRSELNGEPVLNLVVKEMTSGTYYRRHPRSEKVIVTGIRSSGVDEFVEPENMQVMLHEVLREIDFFDSDIKLLKNNFVGPLSRVAPDFYRFYLVDSAAVLEPHGPEYHVLAFYPRNKSSFGFSGHVYVAMGDSGQMNVRRVEMGVPKQINLNFIRQMKLVQEYDTAPDGSRLKTRDDVFLELGILPGSPKVYVNRRTAYWNHSFGRPVMADSIFGRLGDRVVLPGAEQRPADFWLGARQVPVPPGENNIDRLMSRLRDNKWYRWGEWMLRTMVSGYVGFGNRKQFAYGPINTTASYNSLEGLRLRAGAMTTANLNPHLFGRGYVAYGFEDRRWKYGAEAEYSFKPKKYHPGEFPVHSLKLRHGYDVDRLGSHYLYTNADNFVLSLARMSDRLFIYRRDTELTYTLELENHFSFITSVENVRYEASRFVPFADGRGQNFGHFYENALEVTLRYAPGETFYQSRSARIPVEDYAPVLSVSHRFAPCGFACACYGVNRTELSLSKRFSLSFLGAFNLNVNAGHVWGSSVFTGLFIPNANLSYTIQPRSFALMNPFEFVNSSYVSWHACYEMRGALVNLVPLLKRTGIRELVTFSGIYGCLSDACNPLRNPHLLSFPVNAASVEMTGPYMEIGVGLDNILRFIRVDYVWRLNYRHVPYDIDRSGLRMALHFTF